MIEQQIGGEEKDLRKDVRPRDIHGWTTVLQMAEDWAAQVKHVAERKAELRRIMEEYKRTRTCGKNYAEAGKSLRENVKKNTRTRHSTLPSKPGFLSRSRRLEIKAYIKTTRELTSEQITRVEARLDHAEEASRCIGRKDWITLFNGAIFSLILTDTITQDTAQHVILMALYGIGHLFGVGGPPPHLSPGG